MKKILAFVAVAVAAVAMASADPLIVGHGYYGIGLGSTVTDKDGGQPSKFLGLGVGKDSWNFASNQDFGAGIAINLPFGGYFGFQPGVDFYVNNVGYQNTIGDKKKTITPVTYSYMSLDIPLLLTAKINKWNLSVGPYVSIPLGDVKQVIADADPTVYKHSWGSVGASVGVGYEERLGMGRLVFGVNYMHDFMPIEVKNSSDNVVVKAYRGALKVDVSYKVPLSF